MTKHEAETLRYIIELWILPKKTLPASPVMVVRSCRQGIMEFIG